MISKNGLIFFLLMFLSFCSTVLSQFESESQLEESILSTNMENVKIIHSNKKLFIEYENRLYRFEVSALYELFRAIKPISGEIDSVIVLIKNKNVPIIEIRVGVNDIKDWLDRVLSNSELSELMNIRFSISEEAQKILDRIELSNSSKYKFDLVLKPTYRFQFGIFSRPVLYQLNFSPHVEFSLWKGMSGLYEITIPLHNDFSPREDSVRTSMAVLNQTLRLSNSCYISATLGYFTLDRYGFDLENRWYFLNGNLSFGLNLGYTGYASFTMKKIYYSDLYLWTGMVDVSYRVTEYDLTLGLTAGRFLSKDNTIRFDIYRDFGEIQIGFFAMRSTEGISNGGFNFSVPLPPYKHLKPGLIRIRTSDNLAYSYKVKVADMIGLKYETGFSLNNFIKKMNPSFIRNYINYRIN